MENSTRKTTTDTRFERCIKLYQGIRLPCKKDKGYCDPTTHTQATIVLFPEDTCTTFQVSKIHARTINVHQENFHQTNPYWSSQPRQNKTKQSTIQK